MALADYPVIDSGDIAWTGAFKHGQHNTGRQRAGHGVRVCAFKPAAAGEDAVKGLLISSHIGDVSVYTSTSAGTLTMMVCVVNIKASLTAEPLNESDQIESWRDPTNQTHSTGKGRWTESVLGEPPTFGEIQWGGAFYYQDSGGNWRIAITTGDAYAEVDTYAANRPYLFTRPATLSATNDVHAIKLKGVNANTGAEITGSATLEWCQRFMAGFGCLIPDAEWRTALGCNAIIGNAPWSRYPTLGSGLTIFGVNTDDFADGATVNAKGFQYYTNTKTMNGYGTGANLPPGKTDPGEASAGTHPTGHIWNGTSKLSGMVWIPGTATILACGIHAYGDTNYGPPPGGGGNQYNSSDFRNQFWLINANHLLEVKNGTRNPWDMQPYEVYNPQTLGGTGSEKQGICIDPDTRVLYMRSPVDTSGGAFDPRLDVNTYLVTVPDSDPDPPGGGGGSGGSDGGDVRKPFIPPKGGKGGRHVFGRLQ